MEMGNLRDLPELHQGCQVSFPGSRGKVGFLSRRCRGKGPHLTLRGKSPGFSRLAAGNLEFLSSCDGDLRDPLVFPQESQVSIRVARGLLGFLSSQCRGIRPHLKLRPEPQVSSSVLTWLSGFLWSFNREVKPCLMWTHGTPLPSQGVKEVSSFLSSGHRVLGLFLQFATGLSHLPSCFELILGVPVKSVQGNQAYLEWKEKSGSSRIEA